MYICVYVCMYVCKYTRMYLPNYVYRNMKLFLGMHTYLCVYIHKIESDFCLVT